MTRVVIVHTGPKWKPDRDHWRANWDVFSDDPADTAESLHLDEMDNCKWVKSYLKAHPGARYVGSEDNLHASPNSPPESKP